MAANELTQYAAALKRYTKGCYYTRSVRGGGDRTLPEAGWHDSMTACRLRGGARELRARPVDAVPGIEVEHLEAQLMMSQELITRDDPIAVSV